jgi:aldehyde:ferredoxin oxidoreductase
VKDEFRKNGGIIMKILRVNVEKEKITFQDLPEKWRLIGGSGLIAKIMNEEVPPDADSLGAENKLIIAAGPLAGTMAPQLGRISIGAKSPLTMGIKEANSGGPAAQKLDKLGIRSIIVEGANSNGKLYCLTISKDKVELMPADEYSGMKNYKLVNELYKKYDKKSAIICIGIGGERLYKSASISLTDNLGEPSRNAARGGLGAVMGTKGLKAIIIDDSDMPPVDISDSARFKNAVKSWVNTLQHDVGCGLFSTYGTPLAVANSANQGAMPWKNYRSGKPEGFWKVNGDAIQKILFERGGKMHACMPGCVIQCSIIYPDQNGDTLTSAYEYEIIAMLGTNLGITDPDAIGRLKFICDDLGIDGIEIGSSLSVSADAGRMKMGDEESATKLLREIEEGTDFGNVLASGVVKTAQFLNISRIPAIKGQAIPGHDPRAVKGTGVTYATSPMGADHTAGLTYRAPQENTGQDKNSLRFQIQAATCDTMGYCLNAVPGGQASLYGFLAELLSARYGLMVTTDDVVELGKETLRDQLKFNEGSEFGVDEGYPDFIRTEALPHTNQVFDVDDSELSSFWNNLDSYREQEKIWEIRFPTLPPILFGAGVVQIMGSRAKRLNTKNILLISDPVMETMGRTGAIQKTLEESGISSVVYSEIVPDPPVEEVEKAAQRYREEGCDGLVALGGGSSMDLAKAIAVRISQPGVLTEYESIVGGTAKIKPPLPPVVCIPTTSGTGSEVNPYAVITDKQRDVKFMLMSNLLTPSLAVVDPILCKTMPPALTVESGIDALAHCIEGYVGLVFPYHPYYEALALYGVKLIGRSLRAAYENGEDLDARTDMCMAAIYGGLAFSKGLGIGHAITHVLGSHYHIPHGRAATIGLLCFVRANQKACREAFSDLAWMLNKSADLEKALLKFYKELNISTRLRDMGVSEGDLEKIAFYSSRDAVNIATNPASISGSGILKTLKEWY